jgi:hypothetical protein
MTATRSRYNAFRFMGIIVGRRNVAREIWYDNCLCTLGTTNMVTVRNFELV